MKLLKKMSAKEVIGNILARFPKNTETKQPDLGAALMLFRVMGVAQSFAQDNSTYGQYTVFKGQFEAIDHKTGEIFRASKLFLPEVAEELLISAVAKCVQDGGTGVTFGFDVGAKIVTDRANAGIMKYEYIVTPLIDVAVDDPLAALKKTLPPLAIEAPKAKETAPESKPDRAEDPKPDETAAPTGKAKK